MLTLFKKLLGRSEPPVKASASSAVHHEPIVPIATVEVAHLSLTEIVSRLPEDLRNLVRQEPCETATVALPIPTILKQLPAGAVKMSLATLHRQAPAGVFAPIPQGDKRMVSVPLAEVFRHISPHSLKRRPDQRIIQLPPSEFTLFGNSQNPYEITGIDELGSGPIDLGEMSGEELRHTTIPGPSLRMPSGERPPTPGGQRVIAPPPEYFEPSPRRVAPAPPPPPPKPALPKSDLPPLRLPLAPLTEAWPEEIKGEIAALNGSAVLVLPAEEVTASLAKGKVVYSWGEIRGWLEPALQTPTTSSEVTPLTLPLKIVAPAFLAISKQSKPEARKVTVAADIPELFSGAPAATPEPAAEAAPETSAEATPPEAAAPEAVATETDSEDSAAPAAEAAPELQIAPDAEPAAEATPVTETPAETEPAAPEASAEPAISEPAPDSAAPEAPAESVADSVAETPVVETAVEPPGEVAAEPPATDGLPTESVGALFGEANRAHWTPTDLVARVVQLPGIAGAIVALQEGLVVAQSLPEDVKGEVVAAFLPQIFARLNQYAGEMKLGEADDLLFTTRGAHCQIYRLGIVYFAVLGKPGESLPWNELRLIADELAKQSQPS